MSSADVRLRAARACAALAVSLAICTSLGRIVAVGAIRDAAPSEVRALWVLRTSLSTPDSILTLVRSARDHGFNTLVVQVRGRGDAYYARSIEPRAADLQRQAETFDPLATVLEAAHNAGLRVHAWVN